MPSSSLASSPSEANGMGVTSTTIGVSAGVTGPDWAGW
jgi:hypothetical protein